jgi:hypothetical protein
MESDEYSRLKKYLKSLDEKELWDVLIRYFDTEEVEADLLHSPGEHGMDLVVSVDRERDLLGKGYIVVVQAKTGKLGLSEWRNVLLQLLETPYYDIPLTGYDQKMARRLLLVVAGSSTEQARNGISEWNEKHDHKVEVWDIYKLIRQFARTSFASQKLSEITTVGGPQAIPRPQPIPKAAARAEPEPLVSGNVEEETYPPPDTVGEQHEES